MVDSLNELTNSDPGADPLVGTICDGTYKIVSRIGKGGMGSVYRAHHLHLDREAAIKILRGQAFQNPASIQRFRQEARSLSLLSHPNIVHCYAFGIHEDHCFLSMDFVDGTTLQDDIAEHGPLSEERFFKIFHQVLLALSHAHASSIIHRDLKPENIMLVQENNQCDIVKLVDFGIAKISSDIAKSAQKLTQSGGIVGSPLYMSPEQCSGKALDARSDLYSLGCVMFFALTGSPPFREQGLVDTVRSHIEEEPPPLPHHISGAISNLIETAMSKAPSDRFASATDMDAALTAAAGAATGELRRKRRGSRRTSSSLVTRHPRVVSAVLIALSLAALGSYKLLHDPATELNKQLIDQEKHYLTDVAITRAAAQSNAERKPTPEQYLALSQSFDRLMQARLRLAAYQLEREEDSHAAAVMSDFIRNIRDFETTCHTLPCLGPDTISGITTMGRRLIAANQRMSGGLCIVLANHLCRVRLEGSSMEKIAILNAMEEAVEVLGSVELEASHFDLPGTRRTQLPTQLEGYVYMVRFAEEPERIQKLASEIVAHVKTEKPSDSSEQRSEQATRFINAAAALDAALCQTEAVEVMDVANRICHLDEADPDGPAPAAGYYSAVYRYELNHSDPQVPLFLNKALKAAVSLDVNTTQIQLLYADFCKANQNRPGVYAHLRAALNSRGFNGHLMQQPPRYKEAHFRLGEMLAQDGKKAQSLSEFAAYKQAIEKEFADQGDSAYFANYNRLLNTLTKLGLSDATKTDALMQYQQGCALKNLEQQARQAQTLCTIAMAKDDWSAALTWANKAIAASEKARMSPWAIGANYANRSAIELAQNEPQKSYEDACHAEQLTTPSLLNSPNADLSAFEILYTGNKGAAAARLNKLDEAEAYLQRCIRACGIGSPWASHRMSAARELATVLDKMGKHDQAHKVREVHKV